MSPRIDVHPDAFYEAAQSLAGDVLGVADGGLDRLCSTLDSCAAMAGSDPGGVAWAAQYDDAAGSAVRAGTDLSNAMYQLVQLLEQTGVNHERADAASTVGGLRAATRDGAYLHGAYEFTHPLPPSASGGSSSPPTGWSLIESAVGYVWPNGHQDRLNAAGHAWAAASQTLSSAADAMFPVWAEIAVQHSPEVDDACAVCNGVAEHLRQLSHAYGALARACYTLAHHIDSVHSEVEHELISLGAWTFGIESLGALASTFSFGTAEAPTQAVEASRIAAVAARVGELIRDFVAEVKAIAETIPSLSETCANVSLAVEKLRNLRIVVVDVEGVPGFRTVVITSRAARGGGQAITSTEMAGEIRATGKLVTADELGSINPELVDRVDTDPGLWADRTTLEKHFSDHRDDFDATSQADYSTKATNFLMRAIREKFEMIVTRSGTIRTYDPATNTFGSYTMSGETRTFFKPTSSTYWERQVQKYAR